MASGAISRGYTPHILTRREAKTAHYHELFANIEHILHEEIELPNTFWYGKLDSEPVKKTIEKIKAYDQKLQFDFIYFVGLNEYYPLLVKMLNTEKGTLNHKKIIMVDYDASYLIASGRVPGNLSLLGRYSYLRKIIRIFVKSAYLDKWGLIEALFQKYPGLKIVLLDERVFRKGLGLISNSEKLRYVWLPDPGPIIRIKAEPVRGEKIRILLVGIQSKRKGIEDIIRLLETCPAPDKPIHFTLSGSFPDETIQLKARIAAMGEIFDFKEGYFSEEIIQRTYQQCDYVMLPYDKSFHGSSGVMGYAAAFGKPMITTSHGCIGFRVGEFSLGFLYESGNIVKLAKIVDTLPARDTDAYHQLSRNCYRYASDHSVPEHQRMLFEAIGAMN